MGKIKINKGGNYTVISNHVLQNNNLSLKAKGLYAFMWSLPDTWDYSVSGLTTVLKEGRDAINEALKELEREGYLVRSILRKGGKFTDMDYTLNEFPDPFMEKHESKNEKPKEKPEPKKKKKSYAQIFEDPKNEIIKQSLVKYIGALRGMNYTPQVATVEKFAEFLNAECKGNPVIATVQVLVDLNGIKNKNLIFVGQKIKYPTTKGFVKGCRVRVKKTAERYATGEKVASFVKGSTYTVIQVGSGKCLLSGIMSWVKNEDLSLL